MSKIASFEELKALQAEERAKSLFVTVRLQIQQTWQNIMYWFAQVQAAAPPTVWK